jgi:hypothetical protein
LHEALQLVDLLLQRVVLSEVTLSFLVHMSLYATLGYSASCDWID